MVSVLFEPAQFGGETFSVTNLNHPRVEKEIDNKDQRWYREDQELSWRIGHVMVLRMIRKILALMVALQSVTTIQAKRPNILFICIDDLRPELKCFGKDYIHSPNIDSLAAGGRSFHRHYVQAPTCGASRYALLTGRYGPAGNHALFQRAKKSDHPSLPAYLRSNGYTTVSVGKVSHHPGGRGGPDWDDEKIPEMPDSWDRHLMPCGPWEHPRGAMHGLAKGEIRKKAGEMAILQAMPGPDELYPDGLIARTALAELESLAKDNKPFFLATGFIRPHLPFGAPEKYLQPYLDAELPPTPHAKKPKGRTTYHGSGEFMKYQRWGKNPNTDPEFALKVRRHYAACVSYADAQVGKMVARLKDLGLYESTVIVVWGDHGFHLGEHGIWGKHALFEESLRSPLIIKAPKIGSPGDSTDEVVQTIDLFPTLCDLTGLKKPDFLHGQSLLPQLRDATAPSAGLAISYTSKARTLRTRSHRMIQHSDGYVELYSNDETTNLSAEEAVVKPKK